MEKIFTANERYEQTVARLQELTNSSMKEVTLYIENKIRREVKKCNFFAMITFNVREFPITIKFLKSVIHIFENAGYKCELLPLAPEGRAVCPDLFPYYLKISWGMKGNE